ncbi:hypothetical protein PCO86_13340 [Pectobacteriaceae bacterium CE70]|nr:hypothetical protein PCO86_13340 [Pectobacteriaceae bacterium CE70]WJY09325.1 hypothetical protein PCO80_13215 [Pectobacteriaceae bacterium C80]
MLRREKILGGIISLFSAMTLYVSLACSAQAAPDPAIVGVIASNGLDNTRVMTMYKNGTLQLTTDTANKIILTNPKAAKSNIDAAHSMYWYRGMGIAEYKQFDTNRYKIIPCVSQASFCGIAPEYDYSASYLTIKDPGVMILFSTIEPGWLYDDFTTKHHCQIKAEGGGTYGLGITGTSASCDATYKKKGIGNVFNGWLQAPQKIEPIIAYVLLPKKA